MSGQGSAQMVTIHQLLTAKYSLRNLVADLRDYFIAIDAPEFDLEAILVRVFPSAITVCKQPGAWLKRKIVCSDKYGECNEGRHDDVLLYGGTNPDAPLFGRLLCLFQTPQYAGGHMLVYMQLYEQITDQPFLDPRFTEVHVRLSNRTAMYVLYIAVCLRGHNV